MGSMMLLKKTTLLFLIISSSLLSTSFAGRPLVRSLAKEMKAKDNHGDVSGMEELQHKVQERILRANTKDYGNYDPAPASVKPPFKLIPN
ncbi:protein CASPARIAN STRIP INTEGRITY FACTOR 1-like [Diospyros lotus]|uniref:protein CASPARIAN STRIP INTEGRITY FACTOR 1-like n=1 Tax=Diospyros lotus TaxID=55363 RepID=UPI002258B0B0|nr:protein CASPARIAN STRIP INTEGRITY FACTOR 1-like [Diospyros lotus]